MTIKRRGLYTSSANSASSTLLVRNPVRPLCFTTPRSNQEFRLKGKADSHRRFSLHHSRNAWLGLAENVTVSLDFILFPLRRVKQQFVRFYEVTQSNTNPRSGQYLTHAHTHVTRAVTVLDSNFALVRPHQPSGSNGTKSPM